MTRKMARKHQMSRQLNEHLKGGDMVKHLVDIPEELFRIFGKKYGSKGSTKQKTSDVVIDSIRYRVQALNIETTGKRGIPLVDGKAMVTIGLSQSGREGGRHETARFVIWDHMPQVSGVESMTVWAGMHGVGETIRERVVMRLGNSGDPFNPLVSETAFIAEVMQIIHRLGKNVAPRVYYWEGDRYVSATEARFV